MSVEQVKENKTSLKKEKGFTLIETILALAILMVLTFFFPLMIPAFHPTHDSKEINVKEIELFYKQISREIHGAQQLMVNENILYVRISDDEQAGYDRNGTNIRRRLKYDYSTKWRGNETMLQNVEAIAFRLINKKLVHIEITGTKGNHYERTIAMMSDRIEE